MGNPTTAPSTESSAPATEPAPTTADSTSAPEPTETVDWKAEAEKWKALSRKNETAAKSNAEKAKRLDEIEEQSKSELQKALDAKDAAEKRAAALEVETTKARVAAAKGVDASLLTGTTEEEITQAADRLLAWRGEPTTPKPPASTSANDAGARGDTVGGPSQLTREDLKSMTPAQINEARRQGRLNQIMGVS